MSDTAEILTTIDDYLISIADGLRQAQGELTRQGTANAGGQQVSYYVPRLDFELKMTLRVVEDSHLSSRYRRDALSTAKDRHLVFSPVTTAQTAESSFSAEIISTIRGSFVAVPANDGLPSARLRVVVRATEDPLRFVVEAILRDATGKALSGVEAQFNIDRDDSEALSNEAGVTGTPVLQPGTALEAGVASTGPDGVASVALSVDPNQPAGSLIVVVVDVAGQTETHIVEVAS